MAQFKCNTSSSLGQDFPIHFMIFFSETRKKRQSEFSASRVSLRLSLAILVIVRLSVQNVYIFLTFEIWVVKWKEYGHGPVL